MLTCYILIKSEDVGIKKLGVALIIIILILLGLLVISYIVSPYQSFGEYISNWIDGNSPFFYIFDEAVSLGSPGILISELIDYEKGEIKFSVVITQLSYLSLLTDTSEFEITWDLDGEGEIIEKDDMSIIISLDFNNAEERNITARVRLLEIDGSYHKGVDHLITQSFKTSILLGEGEEFTTSTISELIAFDGYIPIDFVLEGNSISLPYTNNTSSEQTITPVLEVRDEVFNISSDYTFDLVEEFVLSRLKYIEIPKEVKKIAPNTFYYCQNLQTVLFEDESELISIGDSAFHGASSLKSIEIPKSVVSIGKQAFFGCTSLENVIFESDSSLLSLGDNTFQNCSLLKTIDLPSSLKSIGNQVFLNCTALKTVKFEDGSVLSDIGNEVFVGCSSLEGITIPDSVERIGERAFANCNSLTRANLTSISQLKEIGKEAFLNCTSLSTMYIPNEVLILPSGLFKGCSSLQSVVFSPSATKLTTIEDRVFYGCSSLISFAIPRNVTSIEDSTFFFCSSLSSIVFPAASQLESIGQGAFAYCKSLQTITFPASLKSIDYFAFDSCSTLKTVTLLNSREVVEIGSFAFLGVELSGIKVPSGIMSRYKNSEFWRDYSHLIGHM